MTVKTIEINKTKIALCESNEPIITDGQSALDFLASIGHEHDCHSAAINKAAVCEEFFDLTTGIAGEVAQKLVNYHFRLAVIGDFSGYSSRALRDYIYECNKRGPLYFVDSEDEALQVHKLTTSKSPIY